MTSFKHACVYVITRIYTHNDKTIYFINRLVDIAYSLCKFLLGKK